MSTLKDLRKQIDEIDQEIIKQIAKRFEKTNKIGILKKTHNLKPKDKTREKEKHKIYEKLSKKFKISPKLTKKIFQLIMKESVKNHKKL